MKATKSKFQLVFFKRLYWFVVYFCFMPRKKQSYLTKKYKGMYIERLLEFVSSLDKNWQWTFAILFNQEDADNKPAYAKMYCQETKNLIVIKLDPVVKEDLNHPHFKNVRFLVSEVESITDCEDADSEEKLLVVLKKAKWV